jgi:hypothetical protein
MEKTVVKTVEWDKLNNNLYEKTYYYVDDVFVWSEITKVYERITVEVLEEFFQIDRMVIG